MNKLSLIFALCAIFTIASYAQDSTALQVDELVICTSVEDRQPVGEDTAFSSTTEQLYCFTKISGATDTVQVSHVWYHGDTERSKVDLNIKGSPWRTWSSKTLAPEWTGSWRVDVVDTAGNVLKSATFSVN